MNIVNIIIHIMNHPLNRDNKFGAILRFMKWQVGTRILKFPIVYNFIEGTRLIISKGNTTLTGNIYTGMTSYESMSFLLHYLIEADNFVDIGANAGIFSVLAAGVKKANVVAIEPIPETYKLLLDNIAINSLFDKIEAYNLGLGNYKGIIAFTSDQGAMNRVITEEEIYQGESINVDVDTLDSITMKFQPNLIKIDVEGFEYFVLQGGERTLKDKRCNAVILELNGNGEKFGVADESIHQMMLEYGFKPYKYEPFKRILIEKASDDKEEDVIYIRDIKTAIERVA